MKKTWLLNGALLVLVAALGLFVYLKPRGGATAVHPLSPLKAGEVSGIRLERGGSPVVALEKQDDVWVITAPFRAYADPFQVQRLLAVLGATSTRRLPAQDLARFDLDRPQARLVIDAQEFSFGAVNPVTREQYALTGDAVYVIEPRFGNALPAGAAALIRKQLFASTEVPVRFEIEGATIAQTEGGWRVTPEPAESSPDDVNAWIDAWRHASALQAQPYLQGKPVGSVKVELRGGEKLTLAIVQREPELVLARLDQNLQYHFAAETARRLLAPPGSAK